MLILTFIKLFFCKSDRTKIVCLQPIKIAVPRQLRRLVEVGARDVQGLPPLAQPAPRQSYAPMAGKPAPSSHEPPRQAEGTSELNAKLGEKGLMAGRSLSPNTPNPEAPTYAEHEETKKRLNKTPVPNVQRQRPINATNAVKTPETSNPKPHKHY